VREAKRKTRKGAVIQPPYRWNGLEPTHYEHEQGRGDRQNYFSVMGICGRNIPLAGRMFSPTRFN